MPKTIGYSTLEFDYHHGDTENTEKFIKSSVNSACPNVLRQGGSVV
jgi:hypothetical protein